MFSHILSFSLNVLSAASGYNHINDISVVATYLAEVQHGEINMDGVTISNRETPSQSNKTTFIAYVSECPVEKVYAIPTSNRRLPVSVTWNCGRYIDTDQGAKIERRNASFWIEGGLITRVAFGNIVVKMHRPN